MSARSLLAATRRWLLLAVVPGVAGVAALSATVTPAGAATSCAVNSCIQQLVTHVGGLDLGATFETTVPTADRLYVYDTAARLVVTGVDTRWRTTHVVTTPATLTPNTPYTYRLEERDQAGNIAARTGAFTTLHRQVDVMFQTVTVTKDSDGGSPGDFKTWVQAGTTTQVPALGERDISDGQTAPLVTLVRLRDAGTAVPVRAELLDNDCTIPDFPWMDCPFPSNATWNNGYSPLWDWSTAIGTVNTAVATNGITPFHISVNSYVGFVVDGFYTVTFVA